jgi:hypothetical protein
MWGRLILEKITGINDIIDISIPTTVAIKVLDLYGILPQFKQF